MVTRPVSDNMEVRTIFQVPLHRFAIVRRFNKHFITATLRWLMWQEEIVKPSRGSWFLILLRSWGIWAKKSQFIVASSDYLSLSYSDVDVLAVPGNGQGDSP